MKFGHVPRAACLSFPTDNTHGYEIAHLDAIARCIDILSSTVTTYERRSAAFQAASYN
jgi:putative aminopeptidase FrvX